MTPTTTTEQQMAYIDAVQDKSALEHVTQMDWLPEAFRLVAKRYLKIAIKKTRQLQQTDVCPHNEQASLDKVSD